MSFNEKDAWKYTWSGGWRVGWVRTLDELAAEKGRHQRAHVAQVTRIGPGWDGLHLATCPYECDCPAEERRPA